MIKKSLIICGILLFLAIPLIVQGEEEREIGAIDYPEAPRASAFDAYNKYKAGKAIIIHAGGMQFKSRHIVGAYDVDSDQVRSNRKELPNFPMEGIDIFIYCY